jgi:hypothetical protein
MISRLMRWRVAVGLVVCLGFARGSQVLAEDLPVSDEPSSPGTPFTDDDVVIKRRGGVNLLLPRDWPVEVRHGVQGPVPIEEYLSMKFGQMKEKFSETDQRLERIERRVEQVEQDIRALQHRFRTLEERAATLEGSHGDTTQNP